MANKKITAKTTIKEVACKANGLHIKFDKIDLSSGQAERLMDIARDKEEVMLIVEQIQQRIPGI
jgi:hypothetical protein